MRKIIQLDKRVCNIFRQKESKTHFSKNRWSLLRFNLLNELDKQVANRAAGKNKSKAWEMLNQ